MRPAKGLRSVFDSLRRGPGTNHQVRSTKHRVRKDSRLLNTLYVVLGTKGKPQKKLLDTTGDAVMDGDLLQKLDRLSLQLGRDLITGLMGEHVARRRTSGIEFADHRQYSTGDDLRRVDWNAYARLGTLHVRQSQAEHDTILYLLVDGSPSMDFGKPTKFLVARRLAAALGYIALAHLDAVIMATPGAILDERRPNAEWRMRNAELRPNSDILPKGNPVHSEFGMPNSVYRGRAHAGEMFRGLQDLRPAAVAEFDGLLAGWAVGQNSTVGSAGRIAVVISDLLLDGYRSGVKQLLLAGFQVTVLHLLSPEEMAPADHGDLELIDSETNARLEMHLGKEGLAEYDRQLRAWLHESEGWCKSQGASYILVQSDWDIERILLDMLRRRGITA